MSHKYTTQKDLEIWKKSIDLVEHIYNMSTSLPEDEKFGLTSQIKRSAVSVSSNIAEGAARQSGKEYVRFLYISLGSLSELETQLIIIKRIFQVDQVDELLNEINNLRPQILGFIKYQKSKIQG